MQAKKNKVLHITSSLKIGGAERILYRLVQCPQFEHVVFYFHEGPIAQQIANHGVKTLKIEGLFCRYDPVFLVRLLLAIRKENPHVIHALLWSANITARICGGLLRKRVITAYHNNVTQDGLVRGFLDRLTIGLSSEHIAVSEQVAESVRSRVTLPAVPHITVIPNGITDRICSRLSRKDMGISEDAFVVGSVGRFVALKRFDLLLEAIAPCIAQHSRILVMLIGVGPEELRLKELVKHLDIAKHVIFIVGQDACAYYSLFDCFVQCSDKEGISLALLEAMNSALPCIVMGEAFAHPVIEHNLDGLVCIPGDKEMLGAYIILIMMHELERQALAQRASTKAYEAFNEEAMINKYAKMFNGSVVDNPK